MKSLRYILIALPLIFFARAEAQFSISKVNPSKFGTTEIGDSIKRDPPLENDYFSRAKWEAQRRAVRRERNTAEFNATLQIAQTQFDNWAAGGQNSFSGRATVFARHQYQRDKFKLDYKFEARYGINVIDDRSFKNEDEFKLNAMSSWNFHKNWSYAATAGLRSQFSNGYKSREDRTKKSAFMAPGFFDVSVGINYKKEGSPLSITISPVAGNIIYVLDSELSDQGINGVDKGHSSKSQLGSSLKVYFDREFGKKVFRFRSDLYSFTNIRTAPTARWENTLEIRATKFLTTTAYALLYYDKYAQTPRSTKMQCNYVFSIGLAYRFQNK